MHFTRREDSRPGLALRCLGLLIGLSLCAAPTPAGFNRWTSGGPWVGSILGVAADPNDPLTAYASSQYTGVFRTRDGGATWKPITNGLGDFWIKALAVDPASPSTIYAASYGKFLYKSTDRGDHWISLFVADPQNPNGIDGYASALAIDPGSPNTLYVATINGVWKSTDGGCSWAAARQGLPPNSVISLAIDPTNSSVLFAGTYQRGGYRSIDGGASWTQVLPMPTYAFVNGFAVDPVDPSVVYAATSYFIDAAIGAEEGGAIQRSLDGGATWEPIEALPNQPFDSIGIDPDNHSIVFATGLGGVLVSEDAGGSWFPSNTGLPGGGVYRAVPGSVPGLAWAATRGASVFKTIDRGATWQQANRGIAGFNDGQLLIHPNANGTLWVTNYWGGGIAVLKSTDAGRSWLPSASGLPSFGIYALAAMPGPPLRLFTASYNHDGVFRSDDGGATWSPTGPIAPAPMPYVSDLLVPPADPTRVYAATGTLLVSTDAGDSWEPASSELHFFNGNLFADAELAGVLYGHVDSGFQKSVDSGETWTPSNSGIGNILLNDFAQSPSDPQVVLAGASGDPLTGIAPLYRSADRGASWTPSFSGIAPTMTMGSIRFDPAQPSRVYAAGYDVLNSGGPPVYRSLDGGLTWSPYDLGLESDYATALAIVGNGLVVHLCAAGGVYELTLSPNAPPAVSGVMPTSGPKAGGTSVTISGSAFSGAASVQFGDVPAANADTQDASRIVAPTPPGQPGLVSVTVTNSEPQYDTLKRAFVYDFDDVPPSAPYYEHVIALTLRAVTGGCGGANFCPNAGLNRGQAAVQIEKALHGADFPFPTPYVGYGFPTQDVEACTGFAPYITQFLQDSLSSGCGDFNFCALNPVTRAQMVVFLLRAEHGPSYVPPPATGHVFADVPADAFAADYIEAAANEGITAGCGGGNFCPGSTVTRAQAAVLIHRSLPETP